MTIKYTAQIDKCEISLVVLRGGTIRIKTTRGEIYLTSKEWKWLVQKWVKLCSIVEEQE